MCELVADAPYVRAWHARYAEAGLVVVGVHAPEFSFEHELANVQRAVSDLDVRYPVVIDNDFSIWRAFDNHYWPALYVLDRDGRVGFQHFGEEAYAESERAIQTLLGLDEPLSEVDASGIAAPADWTALNSPETYLGSLRGERRGRTGLLARNQWALSGDWTVAEEFSALDAAGGSIAYRFEGRDVNLVLGADAPVGFTVTVDGEPPGAAAGRRCRSGRRRRVGGTADVPTRAYSRPGAGANGGGHVRWPGRASLRLHVRVSGPDRLVV